MVTHNDRPCPEITHIHPTGYRPQMMLQEGNVFIGAVCSRGGGREHQIHHEIGHMVGTPLPGYQTW